MREGDMDGTENRDVGINLFGNVFGVRNTFYFIAKV